MLKVTSQSLNQSKRGTHMTLHKLFVQRATVAAIAAVGAAIALPLSAQTTPVEPAVKPEMAAPKPAVAPAVSAPAVEAPTVEAPTVSAPTVEAPAMPVAPAPATATAAAQGTIVDVAAASDTFKTLVAALTEAELTEVLKGEGPFTVFAPTDAAFAALPEGTIETLLLPENRDTLVKILTYHVVPGSITSDQIAAGDVTTVEGSAATVAVTDNKVTVEGASVVQADILASNGVIHAIDQVIMPPGLQ
jgi:uncharacterized surface protein with fasciclin (FAS1) repeats